MNEAEETEVMLDGEEPEGLRDVDYAEFYNSIEEQREQDLELGDE